MDHAPIDARHVQHGRRPSQQASAADGLMTVVDALAHRRAGDLDDALVARLVARGWLVWKGGALLLTETGTEVHQRELDLLQRLSVDD